MSQPSVNVNLGPGTPVLLICPIPRSVTFTVRLGECACVAHGYGIIKPNHAADCPARPIRVDCSISGKTWEQSEVADVEHPEMTVIDSAAVLVACRALWGVVKALVLGQDGAAFMLSEMWAEKWDRVAPLFAQRDAVYAALADTARAEEAQAGAYSRAWAALDKVGALLQEERKSVWVLSKYVEHLIEQVGVLS